MGKGKELDISAEAEKLFDSVTADIEKLEPIVAALADKGEVNPNLERALTKLRAAASWLNEAKTGSDAPALL